MAARLRLGSRSLSLRVLKWPHRVDLLVVQQVSARPDAVKGLRFFTIGTLLSEPPEAALNQRRSKSRPPGGPGARPMGGHASFHLGPRPSRPMRAGLFRFTGPPDRLAA